MIDTFKIFELKYSTYKNAATKAKQFGHNKRVNKLEYWARIAGTHGDEKPPIEVGKFNFDINIYKRTGYKNRDYFIGEPENTYNNYDVSAKSRTSLVKKGPITGYITYLGVDEIIYEEEEVGFQPEHILIIVNILYTDNNEDPWDMPEGSFAILIPLEWINKDEFVIKNEDPIIETWESEGIILFSDRKSAVKFKKMLLNFKDDRLKELFMAKSFGAEWDKFLEKLKSIPVNKFYKD